MKKSTRWVLFFLVLCFIVFMVVGTALGVYLFSRPTRIIGGSSKVLIYNVPVGISEIPTSPGFSSLFMQRPPTLFETTQAIRRAAEDDGIESMLLKVSFLEIGWAQIQELRDALDIFRKSGKSLYAYMESGTNREYYLCSLADKVYAPPEVMAQLGLLSETTFYRRTFEKIKVEPQVEKIGKYKGGADIYMDDDMSEDLRDSMNTLLDSLYQQMVSSISTHRSIPSASVEAVIDIGLLGANQLLEGQFIDEILYPDEVMDRLGIYGEESSSKKLSMSDYAGHGQIGVHFGKKIAVVFATGMINSGRSAHDQWFNVLGSDTLSNQLREIRKDDSICAVVLRIDSPGGSGFASDLIWREIELTKEQIPVIVSMSDLSASGGYYIAMGADYIFAQPGTITGSIGVYSGKFVLGDLYDWAGMTIVPLKRGENSDMFSSSSRFSDGQLKILQNNMKEFYNGFVQKAADGRGMTFEEIDKIAQGRVWTGEQALAFGLVDELGGLKQAIDKAKELSGIPVSKKVPLTLYPREKSFFEQFEDMDRIQVKEQDLPEPVQLWMKEMAQAEIFKNEPFLALMPYVLKIR